MTAVLAAGGAGGSADGRRDRLPSGL